MREFKRGDRVIFDNSSGGLACGIIKGFDGDEYAIKRLTGWSRVGDIFITKISNRESRLIWRLLSGLGLIQKDF